MNLCDVKTLREILSKHGFNFSKSLGQNFLTDIEVPQNIASLSGCSGENVVEIGPGMGCLTYELSKLANKVVAVELDRSLFPVLEETLADCDNVELFYGDVLKTDFKELAREKGLEDKKIYACANLPYYITTPAIATLLESEVFENITVMVQKEVAVRICSDEKSRDNSAFTVFINYYADTQLLFHVPKESFVPSPKVDSAVINITPRKEKKYNPIDEKLFFRIVKAAFSQRRKTFSNAVLSAFSGKVTKADVIETLKEMDINENIRGEKLSINEFVKFSDIIYNRFYC